MAQTLFRDLNIKEQQKEKTETYVFSKEKNPLDQTLLREIETELSNIMNVPKKDRVRITVLGLEDFQKAIKYFIPQRFLDRGLGSHIRVIQDTKDPHHLIIGPSALAGLNEGQSNVATQLVYQMINCYGNSSNQVFDRGASDLVAKELADKLDLSIYTDQYLTEREFTESLIEAIKAPEDETILWVSLLRRNPKEFFKKLESSYFYNWWVKEVAKDDKLAQFADVINSISAKNAQLEGSFMAWGQRCASAYKNFRLEQRRKALLAAAKRSEDKEDN